MNRRFSFLAMALWVFVSSTGILDAAAARGWLSWRGPDQNGTSAETGLPDKIDSANPLWAVAFPGQSTPVIANGRLYIMGYLGEGSDLQEGVACFDAETGKKI